MKNPLLVCSEGTDHKYNVHAHYLILCSGVLCSKRLSVKHLFSSNS